MASGMFSLLFFVLVMSFCPSCCSSRKPAEAGDISWVVRVHCVVRARVCVCVCACAPQMHAPRRRR
ncbi:hypothetical protein EON67_12370 [archaeon]|nr:MAG: hypothetical protein EON67_12370 [archaeon]